MRCVALLVAGMENKSCIDVLGLCRHSAGKQPLCSRKCQNSPFHIVAAQPGDVE